MNKKFIIPRQFGKTISFNGTDIYYMSLLSDYAKRILNTAVIRTDYKIYILDNFLLTENRKIQLL